MGIRIVWTSAVDEAVKAAIAEARSFDRGVSIICPSTTVETAVGYKMTERMKWIGNLEAPAVKIESLGAYLERMWSWRSNGSALIESAARVALIDEVLEDNALGQSMLQSRGMRRALETFATWAIALHPSHKDSAIGLDLGLFHYKYNELLGERNLIERGPALDSMASHLGHQADPVVMIGFSDLQTGWKRYFNKLAEYTDVTLIVLGGENKTVKGIVKQSLLLDDMSVSDEATVADSGETALSYIKENVFNSLSNRNKKADESIQFVSAAGNVAQRLMAIDEICKSLLERPHQHHALLFRNLAPHALGICQELEARGVAFDIDIKMTARATGLGRALYCVLSVASGEDDQRLASSYALSVYSGISLEKATEMNRRWRQGSPTSSAMLKDLINAGRSSGDIVVSSLTMGKFHDVSEEIWTTVLGQLLSRALGEQANSEFARRADAAAHKAILACVSELASSSKTITPHDIQTALENMEISLTARPGSSNVLVADMYRARGLAFDTVVFAGLSTDEFGGASDFLPADRLNSLAGVSMYSDGKGGLLPVGSIQDREKVFIYEMLASVQRKAVLVYETQNDAGGMNQPSLFLEEIFSLINLEDQAVFDQKSKHIIQANLHYSADSDVVLTAQSLHTLGEASYRPAIHSPQAVKLDITEDTVFSPSQIEAYVKCPYYWFVHRYIGLKDIDGDTDTLWLGNAMHELLRLFFMEWTETRQERITEENKLEARDLLVKQANQLLLRVDPAEEDNADWLDARQLFYTANEKKAVSFMAVIGSIDKLLSKEAKFTKDALASKENEYLLPQYFEHDIGTKDTPVVIAGKVKIAGRADRIDVSDQYVTVVDYKGTVPEGQNDTLFKKNNIQLALYIAALREQTDMQGPFFGKEVIGGTYLSYKNGDKASLSIGKLPGYSRSAKFGEVEFSETVDGVVSLAMEALENMMKGVISPPSEVQKNNNCKYCTYDGCVHFPTGEF